MEEKGEFSAMMDVINNLGTIEVNDILREHMESFSTEGKLKSSEGSDSYKSANADDEVEQLKYQKVVNGTEIEETMAINDKIDEIMD